MDKKSSVVVLAGRVGLGVTFLMSGLGKVAGWSGAVAYAASKGVPASLLAGAVALEIVGGLAVLAGWRTRLGVVALLVFLAPVTAMFHGFWGYQGAEQQFQMIQFLKNVSIAGGLLALYAAGPGAISVDGRARRTASGSQAAAAHAVV